MKIAVIGTGISGLSAAWLLDREHHVTIYEKERRLGGHTNTVTVPTSRGELPVDTGFIVFNDRNYHNLVHFFRALGIAAEDSDMSFSVSVGGGRLEWCGSNLLTLFAQKSNLFRRSFHRMWLDILRFNRDAPRHLDNGLAAGKTLGGYLERHGYSRQFIGDYLLPMGAAVWSTPAMDMLDFPAEAFLTFFRNHGLLTVSDQPQWRTVSGGSRCYIEKITAGFRGEIRTATAVTRLSTPAPGKVLVQDASGHGELFDHAILACHGDQALPLLDQPDREEAAILGSFAYTPNRAVLHRDSSLMPKRRAAWASWNYLTDDGDHLHRRACCTYWMNRLQNLPCPEPILVTINPLREPAPDSVILDQNYEHPLFDRDSVAAQKRIDAIQGRRNIWYAGAYLRYGFHEDGIRAGIAVARALDAAPPWENDVPAAGGRISAQQLSEAV